MFIWGSGGNTIDLGEVERNIVMYVKKSALFISSCNINTSIYGIYLGQFRKRSTFTYVIYVIVVGNLTQKR
jgi:hypothetical protein